MEAICLNNFRVAYRQPFLLPGRSTRLPTLPFLTASPPSAWPWCTRVL